MTGDNQQPSQSFHSLLTVHYLIFYSQINMNIAVLLAFSLACAVAAPAPEPYVSTSSFDSTSRGIQFSSANAKILGQINQHNEDGSYTFGYESEDGSFRIENRDIDGYVSGKYGYVDANGQVQEFEYAAGSMNGQAIGYQARGTAIPETNRAQAFPVMYPPASASVGQKYQDYEYSSVDDDRDGFPDNIFHGSFGTRNTLPNAVHLTGTQVHTSFENPSNVVRLTAPTQTFIENTPSNNVRLTATATPNVVPVVNTVQVSQQQKPSVVRLTSPAGNPSNIVRLTSSGQTSFDRPTQAVVNRVQQQQKPSVVRLTSSAQTSVQNPSNAVRFVNPAQQVSSSQQQQQIVQLSSPNRQTVIQPSRFSTGGYQVVKQNVQRQPQQFVQDVGQSVYQSPYYTSYGGQQFVSRNPVYSSGRLNSFLGGRFVVGGNNSPRPITNTFAPSSTQQQAIVIDSDDFDDLNDFDDDLNDFDDDDFFSAGLSSVFSG